MKKQLLLITGAVLAAASMNAQTFINENFEGGSMPAGWAANPSTNGWAVPGVSSSYFAPPAHTTWAGCNDDASQTAANANSILSSPVVNLSSASSVYLSFDAFFQGYSYSSVTEQAQAVYSTDGGTTWNSAGAITADPNAWGSYSIDMSAMIGGQSNVKIGFRYQDGGQWLYGVAVDNVKLFAPTPNDAELTVITPAPGSPAAYGALSSNVSLGGTITNYGTSAITSFVIKYDAGAGVQSYNVGSVNIPFLGTYNFTHNIPYTITAVGNHPVTMWVELTGDGDHSNDTLPTTIVGAWFVPDHAVTIEEGTGTWCGWCVRGIVYMDSIKEVHGNDVNVVAVHNGDPMVVTAYDNGVGTLISGYPSTLVNRDLVSDPAYAFDDFDNSIGDFGFADLYPTVSYNSSTRAVTVSVNAAFAVDLSGDYRLICVYTENGVHNTSGGQWDQHNYYSYMSQNLPLVGGGVDYQALPDVIPSAQMYYNWVARNIQGGFTGQAGSLPSTIPGNSVQSYSFPAWTIPASYNVDSMSVIVMLVDNNGSVGHILNSTNRPIWDGPTGVNNASTVNMLNAYPNPANDNMTVNLSLSQNENVSIEMYSLTGELISVENKGEMAQGDHTVTMNTANLADGMYLMTVRAGDSVVTTRIVIAH